MSSTPAYLVATLDLNRGLVVALGVYSERSPTVIGAYTQAVIHEFCAPTYAEAADTLRDWAAEQPWPEVWRGVEGLGPRTPFPGRD